MLTVFYGEQVWGTYDLWGDIYFAIKNEPVLRECYIHDGRANTTDVWSRGDFTPVLIEDVPSVLRTMILLLE